MVIAELNIERILAFKAKADVPLVVYGNRPLASTLTRKHVQPVSRRNAQVFNAKCAIHHVELAHRAFRNIVRDPLREPIRKKVFGTSVCKRLDHARIVTYHVTLDNYSLLPRETKRGLQHKAAGDVPAV